jgi:hypothetical protein
MPTTSKTKPSKRRLSEVAKHLVLPSGITSTGYPAVAAQCKRMGVVHDDWQASLGQATLAKRKTGLYAAGVTGITVSTPRQLGKTFTFGTIIFALCILTAGTKVLWTAHHSKTTDETFDSLASMARRPQIAPYIEQVRLGNGQQMIKFRNGSRILFGAREHGFGRGIPGVAIVVFDEAQILSQRAVNDMVPAANTVKNPLIIYMGTPPQPEDPAEVFKARRKRALSIARERADDPSTVYNGLYVEIGADSNADLDDRAQWRKANPSYPGRTPEESILRMRDQLNDPAAFRRDGLGIWDEEGTGTRHISKERWQATAVDHVAAEGVRSFGVAFSRDGMRQSVAGSLKHAAGIHLELIGTYSGPMDEGVRPLARWLAERWKNTAMIAICGKAGAAALKQALIEEGVPELFIHEMNSIEYFASGPLLVEAITSETAPHPVADDDDELERSIAITDRMFRGKNGSWGWYSTTPDGDETPVEAISFAHWAAKTTRRVPGAKSRSRRSASRR